MTPPPLIPLLGALLVTEDLLSQSQVEACLLLQQHDYPELRLGEIALRCGYLSPDDLAHVLALQDDHRQALQLTLESQMPLPADLDVHIISAHPSPALTAVLIGMGATVGYADGPPDAPFTALVPDLILVDPAQLPCCKVLPDGGLVALLPPEVWRWRDLHRAPVGMLTLLERYVRQARAQRAARSGPVVAAPLAHRAGTGDALLEAALAPR
jgi:hypothetical protein